MHQPLPPRSVLAADGSILASASGRSVELVESATGSAYLLPFAYAPRLIALSADGALLAAADDHTLSLYDTEQHVQIWRAPLPAPPSRLALNGSTVVAALRPEPASTTLGAWAVTEPGLPRLFHTGPYAVFRLSLANSGLLLVSGLLGPGAFSGSGEPFHRLLSATHERLLWEHGALAFLPDRTLLSASGELWAHTRLQLDRVGKEQIETVLRHTDLETVAIAPRTAYAAWFWGRGPTAVAQLRVARLADGVIVGEGSYFDLGDFPILAVDDRGCATLASGRRPNRTTILRLPAGGAMTALELPVNAP